MALLGHVSIYKRRDFLKPFLHQGFRQPRARGRKPGKFLSGYDLATTLQELRTTNKTMSGNNSGARYRLF